MVKRFNKICLIFNFRELFCHSCFMLRSHFRVVLLSVLRVAEVKFIVQVHSREGFGGWCALYSCEQSVTETL